MDWVLGLPEVSQNGMDFNPVVMVTDRATHMVHFIHTCKGDSADDTAELMV